MVPRNLDHIYASHIVAAFPLDMVQVPNTTLSFATCTQVIHSVPYTDVYPHHYGPPARVWDEDPSWEYPYKEMVIRQYEMDKRWWLIRHGINGHGGSYRDYMWQTESSLRA